MEGIIRTGVCFFCHDGKGNYLLSKRSQNCRDEQGCWDPGGGGLKFNEKIVDAVQREVKEEYSADALKVEFLGYRDVFRTINETSTHWITFDHRVLVDPSQVKIGEPHKCDGLQWITIPEIQFFSEPMHSQFPIFLQKYRDRLEQI